MPWQPELSHFVRVLAKWAMPKARMSRSSTTGWKAFMSNLNSAPNDVIRRRVAVIAIPGSTPVSLAAKAATTSIPIVFGVTENPVALGLVRSLAQPGGNATGTNFFAIESKPSGSISCTNFSKEARIAVLINPANVRNTEATSKSLRPWKFDFRCSV
jgi:putative tryptophan/tyrosine transport system substrate-binding protein